VEDLLHGIARPEQVSEPLASLHPGAQAHDLALEGALLEQPAHLDAQRLDLEGLGHVVRRAALHGLHRRRNAVGSGEHDDGRRVGRAADLGEQIEAAAPGHHQVEQDEIGSRPAQ
jgi:hypothetical protein